MIDYGYVVAFVKHRGLFYGGYINGNELVLAEEGGAVFYECLKEADKTADSLRHDGHSVVICPRKMPRPTVGEIYFADRVLDYYSHGSLVNDSDFAARRQRNDASESSGAYEPDAA